jgi:hypothetical protein
MRFVILQVGDGSAFVAVEHVLGQRARIQDDMETAVKGIRLH